MRAETQAAELGGGWVLVGPFPVYSHKLAGTGLFSPIPDQEMIKAYGCWDGCGEEECLFSPFHKSKVPGKKTHRMSIVYLPGKVILLKDFNIKSNISKSKIP